MTPLLALLLQIDWKKFSPENLFGRQILERTPAGLTIVYIIGVGILVGFLFISFIDNFGRPRFLFEMNLPSRGDQKANENHRKSQHTRLGNLSLCVLPLVVFGFQVYWVYFADETNQEFQALSYKDLRMRRVGASALRPWILDRSGKLDYALGKLQDRSKR